MILICRWPDIIRMSHNKKYFCVESTKSFDTIQFEMVSVLVHISSPLLTNFVAICWQWPHASPKIITLSKINTVQILLIMPIDGLQRLFL